jgi:hypothetical protein
VEDPVANLMGTGEGQTPLDSLEKGFVDDNPPLLDPGSSEHIGEPEALLEIIILKEETKISLDHGFNWNRRGYRSPKRHPKTKPQPVGFLSDTLP